MKVVYVVSDCDDRRNVHAFTSRRNAIQYVYDKCRSFGAYVSVKQWDTFGERWHYQSLYDAVGDNNPIDYLNTLNDEDLNDVFYEYYLLQEVEIEDAEN